MNIPLDIQLMSPKEGASPVFLSVGYGNAHIVIEVDGPAAVERLLAFIFAHREERGAHWVEVGRYVSCPVTFTLGVDSLSLIIDSDWRASITKFLIMDFHVCGLTPIKPERSTGKMVPLRKSLLFRFRDSGTGAPT